MSLKQPNRKSGMSLHEHPHYTLKKAISVYALVVLFLFYEMGLQVSPSVMAFDLMRDFSIDSTTLGLMAGCYFYSYSLMQLPAGLMYDRLGARMLLTLAAAICVAGAFFFSLTYTVFWAAVARFLMGFGSAFAFTGVLVVAAFWFKPQHFAFLTGMAQFFAGLGAIGGAYPLALLIQYFGWRQVMSLVGFVGIVLGFFIWLIVRDHPKEKQGRNLVSTPHIKESVASVFKKSQNWWSAFAAFTSWGPVPLFAALWGGPFMVTKFNVSNEVAASAISFIWVGMALTSPFLGWLSDRIKRRVSLMQISALVGLASTLILIYVPHLPFWSAYILLFFLGAAACSQLLTFALIKDRNKPTSLATVIGFNNMAVVLGGAIFQPIVGVILDYLHPENQIKGVISYTTREFYLALMIMPICYLVFFLVSTFMLKETYCVPTYLKKVDE